MENTATHGTLPATFKKGEKVCIWRPSAGAKGSHKLTYKLQGPCTITMASHPQHLVLAQGSKYPRCVHADHIRHMDKRAILLIGQAAHAAACLGNATHALGTASGQPGRDGSHQNTGR